MPESGTPGDNKPNEKAVLARVWGNFDTRYMKPLLTHSRPTLLETLPVCCNPLARLLTTTEQMTQVTPWCIYIASECTNGRNVCRWAAPALAEILTLTSALKTMISIMNTNVLIYTKWVTNSKLLIKIIIYLLIIEYSTILMD